MGGTPLPPFTDKIFGKKGVTDLGGTPPPLYGQNPQSSIWSLPLRSDARFRTPPEDLMPNSGPPKKHKYTFMKKGFIFGRERGFPELWNYSITNLWLSVRDMWGINEITFTQCSRLFYVSASLCLQHPAVYGYRANATSPFLFQVPQLGKAQNKNGCLT